MTATTTRQPRTRRVPPKPKQPARYVLVHHAKPFLANETRTWHWTRIARNTKLWRHAFATLAREANIPQMNCVRIQVTHYVDRIGNWPDVSSCYPSTKAAVDGLVDAGVIVDDDPEHLIRIDYLAPLTIPESWKRPGVTGALELVIEEVVK